MSERAPPDKPPRARSASDDRVGDAAASTRSVRDSDAGKVTFRHGGAVWEWNTRTGAFDLEETTLLLRRLDNPALSLDEPLEQRDLTVSGEVARQQQAREAANAAEAADHGRTAPEPVAQKMPGPEDWALQTLSLEQPADAGTNPYDSLSGHGPRGRRHGEAEGDVWAWALRSGPSKARQGAGSSGIDPRERRERGYNPYGDEDPPPSRRRR